MKYTYTEVSPTRLKEIRRRSNNRWVIALVTEVLALRREVTYWRSLTHVSLGGERT